MSDVFRETRERVSALDAARRFGLEFGQLNRCKCPFHQDHHPSMSFRNGRWKCWVCDIGGDSIDLTARLFHLTPLEAVKRLNEEFHLGLSVGRPPTAEERVEERRRQAVTEVHKQFEKWREETIDRLMTCWVIGDKALNGMHCEEDTEKLTPEQTLAIRDGRDCYDDAFDLQYGPPEVQMELFRNRKGIFIRTERILNPTQKKSAKP